MPSLCFVNSRRCSDHAGTFLAWLNRAGSRILWLMVSPENAVKRWSEIDALRGQPFGFVSAAEGFVFLSAFMAGYIFARRAMKDGVRAMRNAFLRRAVLIYTCHVGMLMFLFNIVAAIGISTDRQTIKHLISFYLNDPVTALVSSLFLIYNPPLLDILPLYVVFMLLSPWLMIAALRLSWTPILLASGMIWLCAQFGLDREIYEAGATVTGLKVPFHETGAFDIFAWQFIWIFGLWFGVRNAADWLPARNSRRHYVRWHGIGDHRLPGPSHHGSSPLRQSSDARSAFG